MKNDDIHRIGEFFNLLFKIDRRRREDKMTIVYDPKKIVIQEQEKDEQGNIIKEKITLADHLATCLGCAYCD